MTKTEILNKNRAFQEISTENLKSFVQSHPSFVDVLRNERLFRELHSNNALTQEDALLILSKLKHWHEFVAFCKNRDLFLNCVELGLFRKIVDVFRSGGDSKDRDCFSVLFHFWFQVMVNRSLISISDAQYVLDNLKHFQDVNAFCQFPALLKFVLQNFLLTTNHIEKFNVVLNETKLHNYDVLKMIETYQHNNKELLKLLELNKAIVEAEYSADQKTVLREALKGSEMLRSRFEHLITNNLEKNFSFDELMAYLKKQEKKNLFNI